MAKSLLKPIRPSDWNQRSSRHLLNRAGFGVDQQRIEQLASLTPEDAVRYFFDYDSIERNFIEPTFIPVAETYRDWRQQLKDMEPDARREADQQFDREERGRVRALQGWWLERMATTSRPLEEKMTLFWHGHFASSAQKVKASLANYDLNAIFREHATGNFKDLTLAVGQSPAMLRYLDNNRNRKGRPNENWARELMELFTMGQGNYTENDIKESARAFTGWDFSLNGFVFKRSKHDEGTKTFMGQQGKLTGYDIIDIIFEQPATADFICGKLFRYFVHDDPDPRIVREMADTLRENDYELKPVLGQLFRSEIFYTEKAIGTQIKSPAQFLVQMVHDLGIEAPPYDQMARASAALGQNLFYPPNVKGWDGGRAWINTNTLLTRYNLPVAIVNAPPSNAESMMQQGMMMNPREAQRAKQKEMRDRFQETVEAMPQEERRQVRKALQGAKGKERQNIVQKVLGTDDSFNGWNAEDVFTAFKFDTAGECVDGLAKRFLAVPLKKEQALIVAEALGRQSLESDLSLASLNKTRMNAALHLLLSTAEYQLC